MSTRILGLISIDGKQHGMCNDPLASYFDLTGIEPAFVRTSKDQLKVVRQTPAGFMPMIKKFGGAYMWRNYLGNFEITENRLYLIGLTSTESESRSPATLEDLFPGHSERAFVHWYTGCLRVPTGLLLMHFHRKHLDVHEADMFFDVVKGVVTGSWTVINGVAPPEVKVDDSKERIRAVMAYARDAKAKEGS